jgi:hypothetical protein
MVVNIVINDNSPVKKNLTVKMMTMKILITEKVTKDRCNMVAVLQNIAEIPRNGY